MMKKYMFIVLIAIGMFGTTTSFGQDGPKTDKKEMKAAKKEKKMVKKANKGENREAVQKKQMADKKIDKAEIKSEQGK